jgi:parallel beta-helix repeat protein
MKYTANRKYAARLGLVTGILLFGMGMFFQQAEAIECGAILARGHHKLTEDVTCSGDDGDPALTLESGANLDLNGYTVDCNDTERDGIVMEGRNAKVRNGIIIRCENGVEITGDGHHEVLQIIVENNTRDGIRVRRAYNQLVNIEARNNERRGFRIEGDDNNLVNCLAQDNGRQGFIIDGGSDNKIRNSAAFNNCRDGIEIDDEGSENSLINNYVADNGNPVTCEAFGLDYRPWFYAGIDITDGAEENTVINNRTGGNLGCDGEGCVARERNLWDENVDEAGNCDSTNRWNNNRVDGERAEPECG